MPVYARFRHSPACCWHFPALRNASRPSGASAESELRHRALSTQLLLNLALQHASRGQHVAFISDQNRIDDAIASYRPVPGACTPPDAVLARVHLLYGSSLDKVDVILSSFHLLSSPALVVVDDLRMFSLPGSDESVVLRRLSRTIAFALEAAGSLSCDLIVAASAIPNDKLTIERIQRCLGRLVPDQVAVVPGLDESWALSLPACLNAERRQREQDRFPDLVELSMRRDEEERLILCESLIKPNPLRLVCRRTVEFGASVRSDTIPCTC